MLSQPAEYLEFGMVYAQAESTWHLQMPPDRLRRRKRETEPEYYNNCWQIGLKKWVGSTWTVVQDEESLLIALRMWAARR